MAHLIELKDVYKIYPMGGEAVRILLDMVEQRAARPSTPWTASA